MFSITSFADDLAIKCLDYMYDNNMLINNVLKTNKHGVNKLLLDVIVKMRVDLDQMSVEKNMKIYFFDFLTNFWKLSDYLDDYEKFSKKILTMCKKNLFKNKKIPIIKNSLCKNFTYFEDLCCLDLTGEQKEVILKILTQK